MGIKLLDCTLRDGGQGLENFFNNGIKTEEFSDDERRIISKRLCDAGIDIVEIGCITSTDLNMERYAIYRNLESLSKFLPSKKNGEQIITGLYVDPDTPLEKIPDYKAGLVEGIRVILRYSQLQKSLEFCKGLSEKGYKVFVQPMLTVRYTDEELDMLIEYANEMRAYALYFVDSFGYMHEKDIERIYKYYSGKLDKSIRIGFHAHNNMQNAFSNAQYFIEKLADREVIVDSCVVGMGQGAGNLQTEVIVDYLNKNYGANYDVDCILEVCDILEKFRPHDIETWGYTPLRFVPAIHNAAYKYALAMKLKYNMSLVEINHALTGISDELRHRYTPDNLEKLLKR